MSNLTLIERARVVQLAIAQARRRGVAGLLASPFLRWRYGAPVAEALAMVPQELRPADPSFIGELAAGHFGLSRAPAFVGDGTPFDITPPTEAWARELHGFGWLRHLSAAANDAAADKARALVKEWIGYGHARHDEAWDIDVTGRRVMSWLSNAELLLENVDQTTFDRTSESLVDQLIGLSASWRAAPEGYPRLEALIAVVYGDLCILGHERHLAEAEADLGAELSRQILADGGHISRNSAVVLELMLDLLPLRQCYSMRPRELPPAIEAAMTRMSRMLRFMRLGDGSLARFNGVGDVSLAELSSVLSYATSKDPLPLEATDTRYARLAHGPLVAIVDVGTAPRLELAGKAHAGALSFEMSAGDSLVFVNGGAPGQVDPQHTLAARSTASHTTLCLGDKSTARLLTDGLLERIAGGAAVRSTGSVASSIARTGETTILTASHDAYRAEHGLIHTRRLAMDGDARSIEGSDRLAGPGTAVRLPRDVPFAIRFHLHPRTACEAGAEGGLALRLDDGTHWLFTAKGAAISLEPSIFYADPAGPIRTRQIVLRGATFGETEVTWRLAPMA